VAGALRVAPRLREELGREPVILVNLSGRGDKDMHTAAEYFGHAVDEHADSGHAVDDLADSGHAVDERDNSGVEA
jgi:hypothetical protein